MSSGLTKPSTFEISVSLRRRVIRVERNVSLLHQGVVVRQGASGILLVDSNGSDSCPVRQAALLRDSLFHLGLCH